MPDVLSAVLIVYSAVVTTALVVVWRAYAQMVRVTHSQSRKLQAATRSEMGMEQ